MAKTPSRPTDELTYRQAGVDVSANDRMVELIRHSLERTYDSRVLSRHNAFAGLMRLDFTEELFRRDYREPVLVAGADGVGSKLLLAIEHNRLEGLGIDLVAMNVNDVLTAGAEPLFFLDYVACHRLEPAHVAAIVASVSEGCRLAGCALLGGETAEMPDLYRPSQFDLAGFCVGAVERRRIIDGQTVEPGDVVLGLASSGLHANGFALARRALPRLSRDRRAVLGLGRPLIEVLLAPTRIYAPTVLNVLKGYRRKRAVRAMAHITGGGLPGNVPRVVPSDCHVELARGSWPVPPIFRLLQSTGIRESEMYKVFNMGIGFVMIVRPDFAASVKRHLQGQGEEVFRIGVIRRGRGALTWS